jgi:hypothetical protein
MFITLLTLHNITRWLVVVFAVLALVRAYSGWFGKKDYIKADRMAGMLFGSFMDLQLLLGLILYIFLSPTTTNAFKNFGGAMADGYIRFYAVEHIAIMLIAIVLVHVGSAMVKKAEETVKKHRRAALWYSASILLVLAAIPWPFLSYGRPLLRLFGISL